MYIIPQPKYIIQKSETMFLPYSGKIVIDTSCEDKVYGYAKILRKEIYLNSGVYYDITKSNITGTIYLYQNKKLENESYKINIEKNRINIVGGSGVAVLYGIQTLRQILRHNGIALNCLELEDNPSVKNRGFFHDVTRGRIPTLDTLKKLADKLSFYKINQLQLYIEHSFLFNNLSEVWRDDTPITAEEIIELDRYCLGLGIELIPSIATFSHLYKILNTKNYKHLCELDLKETTKFSFIDRMEHHTIDVSNSLSQTFIENLLYEFMPLFTSKKFNICGDETFDLGKGKNKELADKIGVTNLYLDFLVKVINFVSENGFTPMFWGDVIKSSPELIKKLPDETICLNWGYSENETEIWTKAFAELGVNQYVCPGVSGWNNLINLQEVSFKNISKMCGYAHKYGAEGILITDWGDFGHINHPSFSVVGLIYGSELSWNKNSIDYHEINKKLSVIEFSDRSEKILSIINILSKQVSFGWDAMIFWKELIEKNRKEEAVKRIKNNKNNIITCLEKNSKINESVKALSLCLKNMDSKDRIKVAPYILASEGMKIFNKIGLILLAIVEEKETIAKNDLSEELEKWYFQYKKLWRTSSKESELYRIGEVINWYADFLREL